VDGGALKPGKKTYLITLGQINSLRLPKQSHWLTDGPCKHTARLRLRRSAFDG